LWDIAVLFDDILTVITSRWAELLKKQPVGVYF